MRAFRPILGSNCAHVTTFYGRLPFNGASAPAAWTQGGKGMTVPTRTSAGLYSFKITDPPGGTLVGWGFECRADTIANMMSIYMLTFSSTAGVTTITYTTAVPTSALTAADPPAAATDREFCIELTFSNTAN